MQSAFSFLDLLDLLDLIGFENLLDLELGLQVMIN